MSKDINEEKLQMVADIIFPKNYKKDRDIGFVGMLVCAFLSKFSVLFVVLGVIFLGVFIDSVWKLYREEHGVRGTEDLID